MTTLTNLATNVSTVTKSVHYKSTTVDAASSGLNWVDSDGDSVADSWSQSLSLGGSVNTDYEISTASFGGDSAGFDVNGDGRFNAGDVVALGGLIGTSDQTILFRWDLANSDFAISQADVDALSAVLAAFEGGDGVFGDFNGSGSFTCADGNGASAAFGATIGGASYNAAMDWDQNGLINATDKSKFNEQYWPLLPDLNYDGAVNVADQTLLLGSFGQTVTPWTVADLNGDGAVNLADLTKFLGKFGSTCP